MATTALSRQETIARAKALAFEYEKKYGSCSQCVLAAMQDVFGIPSDDVIQAAYALAGGGGATGKGTCGALAGGMMTISARYGRTREEMPEGLPFRPFALAAQVLNRFVDVYGSPICADVQAKIFGRSYDFFDKQEYEAFEEAGGHRDKCPGVAGTAAEIAAQVLLEAEEEAPS